MLATDADASCFRLVRKRLHVTTKHHTYHQPLIAAPSATLRGRLIMRNSVHHSSSPAAWTRQAHASAPVAGTRRASVVRSSVYRTRIIILALRVALRRGQRHQHSSCARRKGCGPQSAVGRACLAQPGSCPVSPVALGPASAAVRFAWRKRGGHSAASGHATGAHGGAMPTIAPVALLLSFHCAPGVKALRFAPPA